RSAPFSEGVLVFDAAETGEPNLGYIMENRLLQAALLDAFVAAGGRIGAAGFRSLPVEADHVHVEASAGPPRAGLVVSAGGAPSAVRQSIGLTAQSADLDQTAIVATVATERAHGKTAWQRFMHDGTLAFLPLSDGTSSIVWSADNSVATALGTLTATQFATE